MFDNRFITDSYPFLPNPGKMVNLSSFSKEDNIIKKDDINIISKKNIESTNDMVVVWQEF